MSSLLCTRKVYQMTVISVMLVGLITLIIVLSLSASHPPVSFECQQIQITLINITTDTIEVTWNPNPCNLLYHISHSINGEHSQTNVLPHPLSSTSFNRRNCSTNLITISTTVVPGTVPFDDVYANFSILWDGNTAVQNLEFDPVSRYFKWQAPDIPADCGEVGYLVEFTSDHRDYDETVLVYSESFASPITNNIACTTSHINVTTWVNTAQALGESKTAVRVESIPENLKVSNVRLEISDKTRFVWDPPADSYFCDIEYKVHFTNGFPPAGELVTTTDTFFDIAMAPCSYNRISIVAFVSNDDYNIQSDPVDWSFKAPAPENLEVRNVRFENIDNHPRFVWDPPDDSDLCDIEYKVEFTNQFNPNGEPQAIRDTFFNFALHPCSDNSITITTSVYSESVSQSDPVNYAHREPAPENLEVQNVKFENLDSNPRFVWDPPDDSGLCDIQYKVQFTNQLSPGGEPEITRDTFFNFTLYHCSDNRLTIITSVYNESDSQSDPVTYSHRGPTPENLEVQNVKFENLDNNPRFVWEPPDYSDLCDIEYKVEFTNQLSPNGEPDITRDTFFDFTLYHCSDNRITIITSVYNESDSQSEPVTYAHRGPTPENLEVQNVKFVNLDSNPRFVWDPPDDSGLCDIEYKVQFTNQLSPGGEPEITRDTFFDFTLYHCSDNRITIITSVYNESDSQSGPVSYAHRGPTPENLEVQNVKFENLDNNPRFVWEPPDNSDLCDIEYKVEFTNQLSPNGGPDITRDTFFDFTLYHCSDNRITIITSVYNESDSQSEPVTYAHRGPTPENLEVQNVKFENLDSNPRFVWDPPDDSDLCDIEYKVEFTNQLSPNGKPEITRDTFFNFTLYHCSDNRITIITSVYNEGDSQSGPVTYAHRGPTPENLEVQNVKFENLDSNPRFVWDPPDDSDLCDIEYKVEFTNQRSPNGKPEITRATFFNFTLYHCSDNRITIITSVYNEGDSQSGPVTYAHRGPTPENLEVQNVKFENLDSNPRFVWDPPDDSDLCDIEYKVEFTNQLSPNGEPEITRDTFFDFTLYHCSDNRITIITSVYNEGDSQSGPVTYAHRGPTPDNLEVQNIMFENLDNNPRFVWVPPDYSDLCEIEYRVQFTNQLSPGGEPEITRDTFFDFKLYHCSDNRITIITSVYNESDSLSNPVTYAHRGPTPEYLEIRNVRFESNGNRARFVWDPPENSSLCYVEYLVNLTNQRYLSGNLENTTNDYFEFTVDPCSDNTVVVITSVFNDGYSFSDPVSDEYTGPITRKHPHHISTDPLETTAEVAWYILPDDPNWCNVVDFFFKVTEKQNEDASPFIFDIIDYYNQVGEFRYNFIGLKNDTIYTYSTCFEFLEEEGFWYCGSSIEFPTTILAVPDLNVTTDAASEINIFWGVNDNQEFVTGHTVYITAIQPYHFTPAHCISTWNTSVFVKENLPKTTENFNFTDAYASFLYHIEVITHFSDLGISRMAMRDNVITREDTPGYLDIETSYNYEPSKPFNVSLKAKWEMPCDINGIAQNFTYTLKGFLKSDTILTCDMVIGSGILDVTSDTDSYTQQEPTFEIEIPGIYPFFDYVLEVETSISRYSSLTTLELEDVPQAYAPPS